MHRFRARVARERVPLAGTFELTRRCPMRCVHCYLGEDDRAGRGSVREVSTAEACALVAGAAEAGCLNLVLTGGDPLVRPDFPKVYRTAREAGLLVWVFTSATVLPESVVEVFGEFPPALVEVSLYGATAPVYEAVTGVPGSFRRCLEGLDRLAEAGVRVGLKTMILAANLEEVPAIEALARGRGARFRLDPVVCTRLDGERGPLAQRVEPTRAARLEYADPARRGRVREYFESRRLVPPSGQAIDCGAGRTGFHLDADGGLRPCLMVTGVRADAVALGFARAWEAVGREVVDLPAAGDGECSACELRSLCGRCAGLAELEAGERETPIPYLCELGRARRTVLYEDDETRGECDAA
jgi:radical SAM protein with 4Fe4S-binding SPASM domain